MSWLTEGMCPTLITHVCALGVWLESQLVLDGHLSAVAKTAFYHAHPAAIMVFRHTLCHCDL